MNTNNVIVVMILH